MKFTKPSVFKLERNGINQESLFPLICAEFTYNLLIGFEQSATVLGIAPDYEVRVLSNFRKHIVYNNNINNMRHNDSKQLIVFSGRTLVRRDKQERLLELTKVRWKDIKMVLMKVIKEMEFEIILRDSQDLGRRNINKERLERWICSMLTSRNCFRNILLQFPHPRTLACIYAKC